MRKKSFQMEGKTSIKRRVKFKCTLMRLIMLDINIRETIFQECDNYHIFGQFLFLDVKILIVSRRIVF